MRITTLLIGLLATGLLTGCSGGSSPTGPSVGGGNNAGGNGGGTNSGAWPWTASVAVGNILFRSGRNGSVNPAVDSVAVGGTVTWTWGSNGVVPHNVQSIGSPSFTSSAIQTAAGSTYQMTFPTSGVYHYQCSVHGSAMSGTLV